MLCADASGIVSSAGIAGCIDAGTVTVYEPVNARSGPVFGSLTYEHHGVVDDHAALVGVANDQTRAGREVEHV